MKITPQRKRFEITIECNGEKYKHICAAQEEADAIEKMTRSYASLEPKLINVKRLGPLPTQSKRA
ncbi:MAG: hypothetical protein OSA51_10950 [Octadecabacter sp.]|nr:hypothetical protein [Octadecabacter sp.]